MNEKEVRTNNPEKVKSLFYCPSYGSYVEYKGQFRCPQCFGEIYFGGVKDHQLIGPGNINKYLEHHKSPFSNDCEKCKESDNKISSLGMELIGLKKRITNPRMMNIVRSVLIGNYSADELEILLGVVEHKLDRKERSL